ncbi:MAG: DUF1566 domain-containing protein [Syntrophaceae bacterium]|nr:DUF1566 domain-containing protein [Syntrophaceae bacterium]
MNCRIQVTFLILFMTSMLFADPTYVIVDTGQTKCYDNVQELAAPPETGKPFHGQDAQYEGNPPAYQNNGDGTVTDLNTGLMWQKQTASKVTWNEAAAGAEKCRLAGHHDWRLPTIKELYSLILFCGIEPRPNQQVKSEQKIRPFIDTTYFDFKYGDPTEGNRIIDAQYWSSTQYVSTTMMGNKTAFGVNFADGRIKGYPCDLIGPPGRQHPARPQFVRYVRGNPDYGKNRFVDNKNGTISDLATSLMWIKQDSKKAMNWQDALRYAESLEYAGYSDWRLPNAKELQSIVDYSRSPRTTGSAVIDPLFDISEITDEGGKTNYPYFWTSTTHVSAANHRGSANSAVYLAFGEALGYMKIPPWATDYQLLDVHGAGAQRSDFKAGDPMQFPLGRGPQGDIIRIYNYVRCVRTDNAKLRNTSLKSK